MTRSRSVHKPFQADVLFSTESQYLKIRRSSKRFAKLMSLAESLDCSWQSLAREAIDMLLDSRLAEPGSPSQFKKPPKN